MIVWLVRVWTTDRLVAVWRGGVAVFAVAPLLFLLAPFLRVLVRFWRLLFARVIVAVK